MTTLHVGNEGVGTDGVNGKVGIGTTNPGQKLSVEFPGSDSVQIASFLAGHATNNEIFIGQAVANDGCTVLGFNYTADIAYMQVYGDNQGTGIVIKKGGYVGIGRTNPQYMLDVKSSEIRIASGATRTIIRVIDEGGVEVKIGWSSALGKWQSV